MYDVCKAKTSHKKVLEKALYSYTAYLFKADKVVENYITINGETETKEKI